MLAAGCGEGAAPEPAPAPTSAAPAPMTTPPVALLPVRVTRAEATVPSVEQVDGWLGPRAGDSPLGQVLHQLRYETLMQARVRAPTSARCARLVLNSGSVDIFGDRVDTDRFVVRAEAVRGEMWTSWGRQGAEVRCTRVPALRVLPAGPTGDRCQYRFEGGWETLRAVVTDGGAIIFGP